MTMTLAEIAKDASERAAKNASVAPQLLYAPILWALQDAAEINRILNMPEEELAAELAKDGETMESVADSGRAILARAIAIVDAASTLTSTHSQTPGEGG